MKFKTTIIIVFIALVGTLTSCHKDCQCTFFCPNGGCLPYPAFWGVFFDDFNQHEMSAVNVKLYNPGTNFTDLADSFTTSGTISGYDSSAAFIGDSDYAVTVWGHTSGREKFDFYTTAPDIILYVAADNTTIKISNITIKPGWCNECKNYVLWEHFINSYFIQGTSDNKGKTVFNQNIIISK